MANIKVTIDYPISDGTKLKFRTPCESTEVEGLVVKYPVRDGVGSALKTFRFVDAHGKELSGVGNVFTSDVMIEILLDVTKGRAFIQNADTNSYIEDIKVTVKRMDEERQTIFAEAGKSIKECNEATKECNEATNNAKMSAYDIAVKNGFEGTETEWLKSLKGDKGDKGNKGDKGDNGIGVVEVASLSDITTGGIYEYNNNLYTVKQNLWNTDLSIPLKCINEEAVLGAFPVGDNEIKSIPLLKYANTFDLGASSGYIYLELDSKTFSVYMQDSPNGELYSIWSGFEFDEVIDWSSLITEYQFTGLGEDINGNWALIKQYFVEAELDISKIVNEADIDKNTLKDNVSGASVIMSDISPLEHNLKVNAFVKNIVNPYAFYFERTIKGAGVGSGIYMETQTNAASCFYIKVEPKTSYTFSLDNTDFWLDRIVEMNEQDICVVNHPFYTGNYPNTTCDLSEFAWVTNENTDYIAVRVVNKNGETFSPEDLESIGLQIEKGATATSYVPFVNVSDTNIKLYGLNLFDGELHACIISDLAMTNYDVTSAGEEKYQSLKIYLPAGTYSINASENINVVRNVLNDYYSASGIVGETTSTNKSCYQFTVNYPQYVGFTFRKTDEVTDSGFWRSGDKIWITLGTTATEYEPYKEPVTYTPRVDGTVKGVKSIYPTTTILTDTDGVTVDVTYNKDINKAFAEMVQAVQAIISLGGNV